MPLTAQQVKEANARRRKARTKDVEVAGLGTVRLCALAAGAAIDFQYRLRQVQAAGGNDSALMFELVAASWIDEQGEPLMPTEDGIAAARDLDPRELEILVKEALLLNGLSQDAIEDAVKNSDASRHASTPTGSPETLAGSTSI